MPLNHVMQEAPTNHTSTKQTNHALVGAEAALSSWFIQQTVFPPHNLAVMSSPTSHTRTHMGVWDGITGCCAHVEGSHGSSDS
jgi:hypothetical protein